MAKDDTKEFQDAYDKLSTSARRKFISEQKSTEEYQTQVDLSKQLVSQFKQLNDLHKSGNDSMGKMADFSNKILSDTKARGMITRQMESDIENAHDALIQAKSEEFELSKKIQRSMVEQSLIAKMILRVNEDYKKNEQEKIDLSKQLLSLEAEMDDAQRRSIHNEEDLSAEYSNMMKQRDNLQEQIVKNGKDGESILKRELAIRAKMPESIKAQLEAAQRVAEAAERELKARQQLLKDMKLQAGYMAHMEDDQYSMLGPAAQIAMTFKKFGKDIKIIPLQFLILTQLIKSGIDRFVALDKAAEDFRRSTGFSNTQMVELRKNAESVNVELQEFGVGIEQAYSAAKALTDVFGHTSLVTKEAMTNVALMNANLNVAVEDSAAVLATFQGLGGATQEAAMNMMKIGAGVSEKAGVPFSLVMKDIANASEQTTALLGANPSKLMKSAIAARALGTDMNKIVASQRKLLDYSSSMNDELELSALLGRSISFQKSRQLAYDGDIAGAAKATLETVKAAGDFDKMSVYQREALAKASGMELKDLTKMMAVDKQREEIKFGGDQAAIDKLKLQDETLKKLEEENDLSKQGLLADGEKAIRQQKMQGQMTKMKNIMESLMVSIGDVLEPIITMLSEVVVPVFSFVAKVLRGVLEPISWIAKGIGFIFDSTTSWSKASEKVGEQFKDWETGLLTVAKILGALLLTATLLGKVGVGGLMKTITSPLKMVKDVGKNMLGKLTGKGAASDLIKPKLPDASAAGDGVGKAAKATENVKSGTGVKDFLTNLAAGLKEMGNAKVLFGAFNLIPASIGLIAMIPGFFGAKLLEQIDGKSLKSSMTDLAEGLEKMGTGSVAKGSLVMILAGVGFAAMTVGAIGLGAVALFGVAAGVGLTGLAVGLAALGNPVVGLGVLVLLGVSLAFVGIAYAIKLASEAFINIAKILPEIIVPLMQFAILSPLLYIAAGSIGALALSFGMLAAMTLPALVAAAAVYIIAKSVDKLGDSFEKTANGISLFSKTAVSIINPIKQLATANLKDAATGISSLGSALSAFGTGSAVAGIGSFIGDFLGGDPIAKMEKLASIGDKLKITADSIAAIAQATSQFRAIDVFAESVTKLATSLGKLNDELGKIKSEELSKLSQISSAAGATSKTEESKSMKVDNSGIEAKLDKLTDLLVGGAVRVYIDGADVSSAIARV